jgi:hypothetical protein
MVELKSFFEELCGSHISKPSQEAKEPLLAKGQPLAPDIDCCDVIDTCCDSYD